jgi:hypothetical protein
MRQISLHKTYFVNSVKVHVLFQAAIWSLLIKFCYAIAGMVALEGSGILDIFFRNDSAWYSIIAHSGYPSTPPNAEQSVFSFFPLYPTLVAAIMQTGCGFHAAALVVSVGTLFIWLEGMRRLLHHKGWTSREYLRFIFLFQLLPFHHFHQMFYTEQLFTGVLVWLLLAFEKQRHTAVWVLSFLLALIRPTGLIFSASLFILYLPAVTFANISAIKKHLIRCLPLTGAPLALGSWMLYLHHHAGDFLAFSRAQPAWGRRYSWPWESFFNHHDPAITFLSIYSLLILLFWVWLLRSASWNEKFFHALQFLFPLSTAQVISFPRYVSANIPAFLHLRSWLNHRHFALILALSGMLHIIAFTTWLYNTPVWSF